MTWTSLTFLMVSACLLTSHLGTAWDCPADPLPQNPCYCIDIDDLIWSTHAVHCEGMAVTQAHIEEFITAVSKVNNMSHGQPIPNFHLRETSLPTLDLTIFNNTRFKTVQIWDHTIGEISGASDLNLVITDLNIAISAKALIGLLQIEKVAETVQSLHWYDPNMADVLDTPDFASALSLMQNVKIFYLLSNNIQSLTGIDLTPLKSLEAVTFPFNKMQSIGDNAILLPDTGKEVSVDLSSNELSNEGISANSGFSKFSPNTPVNLGFEYNNFESISKENFKDFLDLNSENYLNFRWNKFNCSCEMKWLKDGADMYQTQTNGLSCENDPGKTIFTTELVDLCP